ncbi:MAG: ATP-binding cassette domain-containing protein [Nitrospiraceae bacterium]|nr:ATP-binding cassette domain-containing protein [Nitrospiraceae bacterium]
MSEYLLELKNLKTHFPVRVGTLFERTVGTVKAVDGVSLGVPEGEVLGLVGESGCGKSTLARTVLGLVPATSGTVLFEGRDLRTLLSHELRALRPRLQMVFQDPYASLNPRMTVFDTIAEPLAVHTTVSRRERAGRVGELMERVGLARRLMKKYPHEFSGGQRQRIAIARALALNPRLIIADEPVSALDVSVQAQILNLIAELSREMGLTLLLISHDLAVVKHLSHRIGVMYLGKIVELGDAEDVFHRPLHPYTQALIRAIPSTDPGRARPAGLLHGDPPSPMNPPSGCPFHPRCPVAAPECATTPQPLLDAEPTRQVACWKAKTP